MTVHGKGAKAAVVPLPPRTVAALDPLLAGRDRGPLLLTRAGSRINRPAAARIVARLTQAIGCSKHITPYSLRHSAITAALNAGVSLRDVQEFARHADPRTTVRYDRARHSLDRHASYTDMQYVSGAAQSQAGTIIIRLGRGDTRRRPASSAWPRVESTHC